MSASTTTSAANDAALASFQRAVSMILASKDASNDEERKDQRKFVHETVQAFLEGADGHRADEIWGLEDLHTRFELSDILTITPFSPLHDIPDPMDLDEIVSATSDAELDTTEDESASSEEEAASPPPKKSVATAQPSAPQAAPAPTQTNVPPSLAGIIPRQSVRPDTVFHCDICDNGHRKPGDFARHMRDGPGRAGFRVVRGVAGEATWYGEDGEGNVYQGRISSYVGRLQNPHGASCTFGRRRGQ
ncbi:hypothetical protein LTR10_013352 [Elasticomyces elasticus]|uniref:C2H2-type domain-containing protein n=1 Tax=Exophiala sideris TaxID=1016849 RepID=A0ABR0J4N7_9EURO|nr:hypothetical protein LTR10_013352 [Elasticomyces elasticus]KAK5027419.1 hypothetical protein LTS07_007021 [Exophiala sideris]KAK5034879.1 hypothetical protein LTR13_006061 [Exophiala sideris]KAK5056387.1 hypothetical protein LTR69_007928 [Exophiala sideris]KAK5181124.1 hypothetical protein LTR44_006455 [Eurotiomycetes sp. CCFEE 6388]